MWTVKDPFPYIFDGDDADDREETLLKDFPASQLANNQLDVIETIISSYTIPAKGQSSSRSGYSMSLREIYVAILTLLSADMPSHSPWTVNGKGTIW